MEEIPAKHYSRLTSLLRHRNNDRSNQPPLVKGAPRQRRGIGSTSLGPETCAASFGAFIEAKREMKAAEPADKPGSVVDSHSSRRNVAVTLKQPTRTRRGPRHEVPIWSCSRWGLPCRSVARLAVRSYRTISPLPRTREDRSAVSFCCTFRRLAPPRRYLAPCPVEPGLSSASLRMTRLSGRLRRVYCGTYSVPELAIDQDTAVAEGYIPTPISGFHADICLSICIPITSEGNERGASV